MTFRYPVAVKAGILAALSFTTTLSHSQTEFNFEQPDALTSTGIAGDVSHFELSAAQSHDGTNSVRFADTIVEPYESWTYEIPFDLTSGTVTVWFYDVRGAAAYVPHSMVATARWGGSIIIEDKNNPADFGAVEISELPYGPKYYASEGIENRGAASSDSFDSDSLPLRAAGYHKVDFHITSADTKIYIDGLLADEVAGPGSTGNNLRLRFMYDSPSNGGRGATNWFNGPADTSRGKVAADGSVPDWIYYDDISIAAELPAPQTHNLDFEISGDTADYDTQGIVREAPLPPVLPHDNLNMENFVNQWEAITTGTAAHSGVAAARFTNPPAPWKSLTFDLSGVEAGTSVSLWFYDSQGQNGSYENVRANSIVIEEGANPGNFHAIEISTFPFPHGGDPLNYYLTVGTAAEGGNSTLYSRALGPRSVGWHHVEIGFYADHSQIAVDGRVAKYITSSQTDGEIARAPGLDTTPKLRILADSAGIGRNYTSVSLIEENSYATRESFVFFDEVSIPVATSSVADWLNY